jgi:hypothetical protein
MKISYTKVLWLAGCIMLLPFLNAFPQATAHKHFRKTAKKGTAWSISNALWSVKPQSEVGSAVTGETVATVGFDMNSGWVKAAVPGTVFGAYVAAGLEPDPNINDNIYKINHTKYNQPFWYRTEFPAVKNFPAGNNIWLSFNGINKKGDIYLNGHFLGTIAGLVQRGKFNVTGIISTTGKNALAVLVSPPKFIKGKHSLANLESPTYVCTQGWDWMPQVPGFDSGIIDTVALSSSGPVTIADPWVRCELPAGKAPYASAGVSVNVTLTNNTSSPVTGTLSGMIKPGNIPFSQNGVTLSPNSTSSIIQKVMVNNPKLWWPNGSGGKADGTQYLYACYVHFDVDGKTLSDSITKTFGIRKMEYDTTTLNGPLLVKVNGERIFLKGGNWGMSEWLLRARGKDYETRIRFHKEMNFNIIRNWTGEVTDEAFYNYCDKYGILVWDDFWLNNAGWIEDTAQFHANAIEKVKRLRDHPSEAVWCGANEGVPGAGFLNPHPGGGLDSKESKILVSTIAEYDGNDHLYQPRSNSGSSNAAIHGGSHNLSGSGLWANEDSKTYFTNPRNGYPWSNHSYSFRSEIGTATVTNIESVKKCITSPADWWPQGNLWDNKMWQYHYYSNIDSLGGGANARHYSETLDKSYGQSKSLEEFCKKAQLLNLETTKAMYEGWNDHMWNDATGLVLWMSQSAFPSMLWQTYDYYYDLTGAYFGCKQACEPVHIQWNNATNSIKVINNTTGNLTGLTAVAKIFNKNGMPIAGYEQKATVNIDETSAKEAFVLFNGKTPADLGDVYFIKLYLTDSKGAVISENFYWAGSTYLDYKGLATMPAASVQVTPHSATTLPNGNKLITYTVKNPVGAAFGVRVKFMDDAGNLILPAIVNDDYFSLMQGESKAIYVEVSPKLLASGYKLTATPYNN